MASANKVVDATAYTLLTAADTLVQNVSAFPVRIAFANTLPTPSDDNYHLLLPTMAIIKSGGLPAGNVYARADVDDENTKVVYSDI